MVKDTHAQWTVTIALESGEIMNVTKTMCTTYMTSFILEHGNTIILTWKEALKEYSKRADNWVKTVKSELKYLVQKEADKLQGNKQAQ